VYPTPRCFSQEWQAKDLCLTVSVREANTGLKVIAFSIGCEWFVRVARKGVEDEQLKVEGLKFNEERKRSEEGNAEAQT
jgi:hypothetical protein